MVIKKIQIENYLCYYDKNTFELSEGLNIILGENGEGKTKFFEAVEWLFQGENKDLHKLVSAKKLEETAVGENFITKVSIIVIQHGLKSTITKSFIAEKVKANECSTSNFIIEGIEENNLAERTQVDGKELLDRVFPFQIRKYSMFKGEAELNIFENDNALTNLINLFSEAKHYDKYSEKGKYFKEKSEKAVEESSKRDRKNEVIYKKLSSEIFSLEKEREKFAVYLNTIEEEIRKIDKNIQLAESHVSNADALESINKRIKETDKKISDSYGRIDENYTTSLFDKKWILVNFEPFQKKFASKITAHSIKRRELQSEFDRQKGIKEGEKKAKADLLNNSIPLPVGVPSKAHMEEMLADEICKVCNREAKKDSEAYTFMIKRLKTYLESQAVKEDEPEKDDPLFQFNYISILQNMSINHEDNLKSIRLIQKEIKELFEFNEARKQDIEELKSNLEKEKTEREQILGNSSIAAEKLTDVQKSYRTWIGDLKSQNQLQIEYTTKLKNLESELKIKKEEKDNIDINSANSSLIRTRDILRDIETIFKDTKEKKFDQFIKKLQTKSNSFFKTININSFTGTIIFTRRNKINRTIVEVELQEDGRVFYKPNQSLLTSMHIAILFAISELASEIKSENFPMIFDAPTSSFGENKTAQFLNLIFETKNQKILLIKDFLHTDKSSKTLSIKKEFENIKRDKAFWVKLERPFDPNNLKTINTQIISL